MYYYDKYNSPDNDSIYWSGESASHCASSHCDRYKRYETLGSEKYAPSTNNAIGGFKKPRCTVTDKCDTSSCYANTCGRYNYPTCGNPNGGNAGCGSSGRLSTDYSCSNNNRCKTKTKPTLPDKGSACSSSSRFTKLCCNRGNNPKCDPSSTGQVTTSTACTRVITQLKSCSRPSMVSYRVSSSTGCRGGADRSEAVYTTKQGTPKCEVVCRKTSACSNRSRSIESTNYCSKPSATIRGSLDSNTGHDRGVNNQTREISNDRKRSANTTGVNYCYTYGNSSCASGECNSGSLTTNQNKGCKEGNNIYVCDASTNQYSQTSRASENSNSTYGDGDSIYTNACRNIGSTTHVHYCNKYGKDHETPASNVGRHKYTFTPNGHQYDQTQSGLGNWDVKCEGDESMTDTDGCKNTRITTHAHDCHKCNREWGSTSSDIHGRNRDDCSNATNYKTNNPTRVTSAGTTNSDDMSNNHCRTNYMTCWAPDRKDNNLYAPNMNLGYEKSHRETQPEREPSRNVGEQDEKSQDNPTEADESHPSPGGNCRDVTDSSPDISFIKDVITKCSRYPYQTIWVTPKPGENAPECESTHSTIDTATTTVDKPYPPEETHEVHEVHSSVIFKEIQPTHTHPPQHNPHVQKILGAQHFDMSKTYSKKVYEGSKSDFEIKGCFSLEVRKEHSVQNIQLSFSSDNKIVLGKELQHVTDYLSSKAGEVIDESMQLAFQSPPSLGKENHLEETKTRDESEKDIYKISQCDKQPVSKVAIPEKQPDGEENKDVSASSCSTSIQTPTSRFLATFHPACLSSISSSRETPPEVGDVSLNMSLNTSVDSLKWDDLS